MGRKRIHPIKKKSPKAPRAKMEGLNVKLLQDSLFKNKEYPKYFNSFRTSPELLKIFKILVNRPAFWQDGLLLSFTPEDKLYNVFGADYRYIFSYRAVEDFTLTCGLVNEIEPIPHNFPPQKLRKVYAGDLILIRVDKRSEEMKLDLQILTKGLFQDTSDDFRNFIIDTNDLTTFRKYIKLIDTDGIREEAYV